MEPFMNKLPKVDEEVNIAKDGDNVLIRTSTQEIVNKCLEYGEDILRTKFPNYCDGLKDATRRIVWCSRIVREYQGFSRLVGIVADIHVGGDQSVEKAIIRFAQAFSINCPLIDIQGKSGEYYAPKAYAAPRYLKARISAFSYDVFFTDVDVKTIPMTSTKDFSGLEPKYLIPRLPMSLVLGNLTVGFAFKSYVPMYEFSNVCELVRRFADNRIANGPLYGPDKMSLAKYFVPAFPVLNLIKNRKELIKEYQTGNYSAPIRIDGWIDMSGYNITVRAVPYGTDFGEATEKFRAKLRDKKSWLYDYIDSANQYSSSDAEFDITLKRGKNPFEVWDKIKTLLSFETVWHPLFHYLRNGCITELDPYRIISLWYDERIKSILGGLKYKQAKLIEEKLRLSAMLIICDRQDEVIQIIRTSEQVEVARERLRKAFPELTPSQAKIIVECSLATLTKSNKKELIAKLEQVVAELAGVRDSFVHIHEHIKNDANLLQKKYAPVNITRYSDEFIGYVKYGNLGIIQFFDYEDMYNLLNTKWSNTVKRTIHLFNKKLPRRCTVHNGTLRELTEKDMSKEIWCEDLLSFTKQDKEHYSLVITDEGYTSIVARELSLKPNMTICPVSEKFYAVHSDGKITYEHIGNFTMRKSVGCRAARTDVVYGIPDRVKDALVFHVNDIEPNILRVDRIIRSDSLGRLLTNYKGKVNILHIHELSNKDDIFLNIPDSCRKTLNMEYLQVLNIDNLLESGINNYYINLTKSKSEITITRSKEVRSLYRLSFNKAKKKANKKNE